jgi:hypothetical protein
VLTIAITEPPSFPKRRWSRHGNPAGVAEVPGVVGGRNKNGATTHYDKVILPLAPYGRYGLRPSPIRPDYDRFARGWVPGPTYPRTLEALIQPSV